MAERQLDHFDEWKQLPITLWHNQNCLLCYGPPHQGNGITAPHFDDVYMLWFVCQGKLDLLIDDACYPAPPGSLIWTSPSLLHTHRAAGCVEAILCIFSPPFVQHLWQLINPQDELPHAAVIAAPKSLETTIRRLHYEATHVAPACDHLLSLLFRIALIDLLRVFHSAQQKTVHPLFTSEVSLDLPGISAPIAQAVSLLRSEYFREEVTPKSVAVRVGLSLYDVRRVGKSVDVPAESYVIYQDLYHLLQALALPKASLVGLSGGARISIDLAIAHPEMVQKLVAISPGMSGYEFVDEWTHKRVEEFEAALSQGDIARAVEAFMTMWLYGPYRTPEQIPQTIQERIREMVTRSISQGMLALDILELEPPAIGRLAEIQAPTLILLGEKDTSDIHTIGKLLHDQVATSELVMIPNVAHTLTMEKPSEVNALIAQFLRQR